MALVQVRVNSGGWVAAAGTASWSVSMNLSSGSNTIEAWGQDAAGNASLTASVDVTYNPAPATFTLRITTPIGVGAPAPTPYESGSSVVVSAPEAPAGRYFSHWTGDASGNDKPITVVMDRDKTIMANYEDCPIQPTPCGAGVPVCGAVTLGVLCVTRIGRRRW